MGKNIPMPDGVDIWLNSFIKYIEGKEIEFGGGTQEGRIEGILDMSQVHDWDRLRPIQFDILSLFGGSWSFSDEEFTDDKIEEFFKD